MYKAGGQYYGCAKCSSSRNASVYMGYMFQGNNSSSDTSFYSTRNAQCNACPEYDKNGNYSARYTIGGAQSHCFPVCEQPKNADEQVEICKANPKDERCTRKWQNSSGNCFSCDALTNASGKNIDNSMLISNLGMVPEQLITLCENCGRVHSGNFCVLPQTKDDCGKGKFLGEDGYCHECSKVAGVKIVSEEISGCATNCENITDNKWYNGRRILSYIYNNQELHYCYRKPLDGIQSIQDARTGNFYACSDSGSYFLNHE